MTDINIDNLTPEGLGANYVAGEVTNARPWLADQCVLRPFTPGSTQRPNVGEYLGGWRSTGDQLTHLPAARSEALEVERRNESTIRREIYVKIELTDDQALVLFDWMSRVMHRTEFSAIVDDRAVWSALFKINGTLETQLSSIFDSSYADQLTAARQRLISELGEFGEQ